MANSLTTNPLTITAAMAASLKNTAGAIPTNGPIIIDEIYWLNPASVGDMLVISDGQVTGIKTFRCESANQSQLVYNQGKYNDLQVLTISSGTAVIKYHQ